MLMILYLLIILFILLIYYYYLKINQYDDLYVKDGYYPIIGNLFSLIYNRNKYLIKCQEKYGDCFKIKLFNQTIIFLINPSDWINIIKNQSFSFMGDTFSKHIFNMDHNFFGIFLFSFFIFI